MSVSVLASGRGDWLWWRISQSKKVCFQLFPETRNVFYGSDGLRKLVPLCGSLFHSVDHPQVNDLFRRNCLLVILLEIKDIYSF